MKDTYFMGIRGIGFSEDKFLCLAKLEFIKQYCIFKVIDDIITKEEKKFLFYRTYITKPSYDTYKYLLEFIKRDKRFDLDVEYKMLHIFKSVFKFDRFIAINLVSKLNNKFIHFEIQFTNTRKGIETYKILFSCPYDVELDYCKVIENDIKDHLNIFIENKKLKQFNNFKEFGKYVTEEIKVKCVDYYKNKIKNDKLARISEIIFERLNKSLDNFLF